MAQIGLDSSLPQTITEWRDVIPGIAPSQAPLVTDCVIIGANDAAGELYGLEHPNQLIGQPLSYHRSPEETEHARWACVLAKKCQATTTKRRFLTEIIRPCGERVVVVKHATTLNMAGKTVWVTTFEKVCQGDYRREFHAADYAGIDHNDVLRQCGPYSMATAHPLLEAGLPTLTPTETLISILPETVQASNLHDVNGLVIRGSANRWSRWLYLCGRCGWMWFGREVRPQQCPATDCRSEVWWKPSN